MSRWISQQRAKSLRCAQAMGASFFRDLLQKPRLLKSQLEEALAELAAWGLVTRTVFRLAHTDYDTKSPASPQQKVSAS